MRISKLEFMKESYSDGFPEWRPMRKNNFVGGSIGSAVFPDQLEGRMRSTHLLETDLEIMWNPGGNTPDILHDAGLDSVMDVCNSTEKELITDRGLLPAKAALAVGATADFFKTMSASPHKKMLETLFSNRPNWGTWLPIDIELRQIEGVEDELVKIHDHWQRIDDRRGKVLAPNLALAIRSFGLVDGVSQTATDIAREDNVTRALVSRNLKKGIRALKHPLSLSRLRLYVDLPQTSIAVTEFGKGLEVDVPVIEGTLAEFGLETAVHENWRRTQMRDVLVLPHDYVEHTFRGDIGYRRFVSEAEIYLESDLTSL